MGNLLLAGGGEFGSRMSEADLRAIHLAGGMNAPVRILPTAAAPDNNHLRAGNNGLKWFQSLGAQDVGLTPVIDKSSANDRAIAAELRAARLIYLLGGFPEYLGETLAGSLAWSACQEAYAGGALIAGSSAGAMVLCSHYYDPYVKKLLPGLDLIPNSCVLPHHDNYGKNWAKSLLEQLPDAILIGIDEGTAMISGQEGWRVYGEGAVTLYRGGQPAEIRSRTGIFTL